MTLARPLASNARSASLCGGMLRRRNMDTAESSAEVGGWPRPSFRWQRWQERALNSGPRPSAEVVDDGAVTPRRRTRPVRTLKSSSRLKLILAELCERALWLTACREAMAPPGSGTRLRSEERGVGKTCVKKERIVWWEVR